MLQLNSISRHEELQPGEVACACSGSHRMQWPHHDEAPLGLGVKRGSLFTKQSIFIHLYLLSEKSLVVPLLWWNLLTVIK